MRITPHTLTSYRTIEVLYDRKQECISDFRVYITRMYQIVQEEIFTCQQKIEISEKFAQSSFYQFFRGFTLKQGSNEFLGVKFPKVIHFLADSDIPDRYVKRFRDPDDDSALGRSIQLGDGNTGNS
jgi:hypothetical protein